MDYGEAFKELCSIVERLRGEGGCPWDREQSPETLRGDLLEETYECIEAIDEKEPAHVREELGDLFLLVTMIAYMHQEQGLFSIPGVLHGAVEKLVRRHPHVFGTLRPENEAGRISPQTVLDNWARIKAVDEGRGHKNSVLDEVSRALPPLDRAWKLQKKAAKTGFDWLRAEGALDKLKEEITEVEEALASAQPGEKLEEELGDLLFSVVNLCRFFGTEPSVALQRSNAKFTGRFKYVEKKMNEEGRTMEAGNMALMDRFWDEAKSRNTVG
ncbi:MAG: nucleoside triphosphate pyrophosphohydrolase [Treponema sp.]|jgi:tetrapyrrole methylase family protein/MazG family protein|nr:nucleoside triphosphate pyrophosphohydrolase [Treponema sp.]